MHTVREVAVVIKNALAQVEITLVTIAIAVKEDSAKNWNLAVTLDGEVDVLSRVGEALTVPEEAACRYGSVRDSGPKNGNSPFSLPMWLFKSISASFHSPSPR
jgi:hypothetical protein